MGSSLPSSMGKNRQDGKHQMDWRKDSILNAAETLFLQKGLENTSMVDIANHAGITKVTLYRYFPDRHPIAFEIAIRMLRKIFSASRSEGQALTIENLRQYVMAMIDNYDHIKDAYRYIGMFDHLYGDHYPSADLADWYKSEMSTIGWGEHFLEDPEDVFPLRKQMIMLLNTTMSFLEKMAARGELMSTEQGFDLEEQLRFFKTLVGAYFDQLSETHQS